MEEDWLGSGAADLDELLEQIGSRTAWALAEETFDAFRILVARLHLRPSLWLAKLEKWLG